MQLREELRNVYRRMLKISINGLFDIEKNLFNNNYMLLTIQV